MLGGTVNEFRKKAYDADGFVFGSPVHYGAASGNMTAFMDRLFYSELGGNGNKAFYLKPAACILSARRAGTTAAFDQLNKYFTIQEMPIVSSRYWNMDRRRCFPAFYPAPYFELQMADIAFQREIFSRSHFKYGSKCSCFCLYAWAYVQRYRYVTVCVSISSHKRRSSLCKKNTYALFLLGTCADVLAPWSALECYHGHRSENYKS